MEFPKEELQYVIDDDSEVLTEIETELVDTSRWSLLYTTVFQDNNSGKYYITDWSKGATESQDEYPFDDEPDMVECDEVFPHEVTSIKYKREK